MDDGFGHAAESYFAMRDREDNENYIKELKERNKNLGREIKELKESIKAAYERMRKEEEFIEKSSDSVRADKWSMLTATRACIGILEEECPRILKRR